MSRFAAISLCLISLTPSLLPSPAHSEDFTADSKIVSAIVYSDRATVTRQAIIDIPAGSHIIHFPKMPTTLFPDSLRTEGTSSASVKFGAVAYKKATSTELAAPRAEELNVKLDGLQDQRTAIQNEKAALAAKRAFLNNLSMQAGIRASENVAEINLKPDQWSGAAQAIYAGISEISSAELQADIKIREIDRQIYKVQNDLNQVNGDQYTTYEVTVPLETDTATKLTLDLSYQVPNASWRPTYDARLDTQSGKLDLIQYGSVMQSTGEDWEGIKLSLSTAQPQRGSSLPDLTPYWLDLITYGGGNFAESRGVKQLTPVMQEAMEEYNDQRAQEAVNQGGSVMPVPIEPPKTFLPVPSNAPNGVDPLERWRLMQDERLRRQREEETHKKAQFVGTKIEAGGFMTEYKIPGPASVPSDGTETKLMVGTFNTESLIQVHIKPQLSTDAFLVSKAKLKGESPVLPGSVSLFRDGAYVGQSSIPLLRPDEEHPLFFGVDDQVSVKRKVLKDEKSEAGMIVRDNTQERHFVTEIQNLHSKPVQIVVKETVPTGRNEKISSEILKSETTAGYEADSANIKGLLRWEFPLDPKAKKDVKLGWKVSWPKDTSLSGL